MKTQKGFTFVELMLVLGFVLGLSVLGTIVYVVIHFIAKFW